MAKVPRNARASSRSRHDDSEMKVLYAVVDESLHRRAKIRAVQEHRPLQALVREAVERYLSAQEQCGYTGGWGGGEMCRSCGYARSWHKPSSEAVDGSH